MALRIFCCGASASAAVTQAPECMALEAPVVVASELSCSEAYGILVFRPRIELPTPALEGRFLFFFLSN